MTSNERALPFISITRMNVDFILSSLSTELKRKPLKDFERPIEVFFQAFDAVFIIHRLSSPPSPCCSEQLPFTDERKAALKAKATRKEKKTFM